MKNKRSLAVVFMIFALVFSFSGLTANALSDVDFTLAVEDAFEYKATDTVHVPIIIKTQTDNGFVDLQMYLTYPPDYLVPATIMEQEVDGFTTSVYTRESDGKTGLLINYHSPTGKRSEIGEIRFPVEFSVKTGVASNENCVLSLEVNKNDVFGLDANGNKEKGLLTVSNAKDKVLKIVETFDNNATTVDNSAQDPNFFISTTTPNPDDPQVEPAKGGCSAGGVIGIIFGALVVFAAGVVVGFIWCQKRLNEDGYDVPAFSFASRFTGGRGGASREPVQSARTYEDVAEQYRQSTGRSGSIYDDEVYSQRPAAPKQRRSFDDDDTFVDTDYFGRASETRLGSDVSSSPVLYDDDDDDEFPSELAPRSSAGVQNGGSFDDFGFLGGNRRERNDDGYGSFETDDDDDNGGFNYRSDRRRYR
ncbi:MAG: hypothetical protein E7554_08160 [Ruminococcaceae bacterium]|nr:hypothetical protein [Oscillospiraceae bacterium]